MKYEKQVDNTHYTGTSYVSLERWISYWHQLDTVRSVQPRSVLEIGIGGGVVARELKASGVQVTTVDIAEDLHPDIVGSITELPVRDASFDVVLAAEVLEHIRFEDVPKALREIARVSRTHAIISVPHPGYLFLLIGKFPLFCRTEFFFKLPFFWKKHVFNGEHYWELGKQGYAISILLQHAREVGLHLMSSKTYSDDPAHHFFLFSKKA